MHRLSERIFESVEKETGLTAEDFRTLSVHERNRRIAQYLGREYPSRMPKWIEVEYLDFDGEKIPVVESGAFDYTDPD